MLLRTRITLMVSLSALVLVLALIAEGRWREHAAWVEMDASRLQSQRSAWQALERTALQPLDALARTLVRNGEVAAALATTSREQLAAIVKVLQGDAGEAAALATVEIALLDGTRLLAGTDTDFLLTPAVVAAAGRHAGPLAGIVATEHGQLVLAVVAPLYSRTAQVGAVGVWIDPQSLVEGLASTLGADAVLTDARGRTPVASNDRLRVPVVTGVVDGTEGVRSVFDQGHQLQVTWLTLPSEATGGSALLFSVSDVTSAEWRRFWLRTISLGGVVSGTLLFLGLLHWYMRKSFHPLYRVIHVLNTLARGEPAEAIPDEPRNDEIGWLAATVTNFRQGLEARDQLLRLRQDLDAARDIQTSILPGAPEPRPEFSIESYMLAARDVGGDFYDFFDLPDGRFGFVIADVSGKGMAAALFMAVARTVIRSTAQLVGDPGECLAQANELLASNNAASMFVTVFYGVLCPASGRLVYANGGHNPPYRLAPDGAVAVLPRPKGVMLAVVPDMPYPTTELMLAPGEQLFLFTDGITEAQNADGELFAEPRLETALASGGEAPGELINRVLDQVAGFVRDAPQADDITCLALQWHGPAA